MKQSEQMPDREPSGSCEKCIVVSSVDRATEQAGMAGWRLVLSSTLVFLLPLMMAIAGAAVSRKGQAYQLAGALGGFFAGVVLAWVGTRLIRPRKMVK
ncbi:MAG: SoxR reducing system RseC family protein [Verrucomicrobiota bacterium]